MKQFRSCFGLDTMFRFEKPYSNLGGGNGNKTASYRSVNYSLVVSFRRFLTFWCVMLTHCLHYVFLGLFLHLWVYNIYQLVALDLLGRFLAFVGVQCLPIGCITSFGTFSCICGCGGCLGGGGNEED